MTDAAAASEAEPARGLETIFHALSLAVDAAGPGEAPLFLTRLAMLAALQIDDAPRFCALIDQARLQAAPKP